MAESEEQAFTRWMTETERKRWNYLNTSNLRLFEACRQGDFQLRISETESIKDHHYSWRITIEDNLEGTSFLHVHTLAYARKKLSGIEPSYPDEFSRSHEKDDKLTDNRVVSHWRFGDSGYDCGDGVSGGGWPPAIILFEPRSYVHCPPQGKFTVFVKSHEEIEQFIPTLKKALVERWGDYSLLSKELWSLQLKVQERKDEAWKKKCEREDKIKETHEMKKIRGKEY